MRGRQAEQSLLEFLPGEISFKDPEIKDGIILPNSFSASKGLFNIENDTGVLLLPDILPEAAESKFRSIPISIFNTACMRIESKGAGAPLILRFIINVVGSYPVSERPRDKLMPASSKPLRFFAHNLISMTYPGLRLYPSRQIPQLVEMLEKVRHYVIRLPDGSPLHPISVIKGLSETAKLDKNYCVLRINLPPGNHFGAMVSRKIMDHYCKQSIHKWRGYIRLACHWNDKITFNSKLLRRKVPSVLRDSKKRILNQFGRHIWEDGSRVNRWDHPKAVKTGSEEENPAIDKNLPWLSQTDFFDLFFEPGYLTFLKKRGDRKGKYKCRIKIDACIEQMETDGVVEIEDAPHNGKIRLLPGPEHRSLVPGGDHW